MGSELSSALEYFSLFVTITHMHGGYISDQMDLAIKNVATLQRCLSPSLEMLGLPVKTLLAYEPEVLKKVLSGFVDLSDFAETPKDRRLLSLDALTLTTVSIGFAIAVLLGLIGYRVRKRFSKFRSPE